MPISNVVTNPAWYRHRLVPSARRPLVVLIGMAWLMALPEEAPAVPSNRIDSVVGGRGAPASIA